METVTKIIHEWEITIDKEVDETTQEVRDGQSITITKKVTKPVVTRMGLKQLTRRELRAAELFYGKEYNRFFSLGFLPRSILINKHNDLTGGVVSKKEHTQLTKLAERHAELENDLVRALNETEEVRKEIRTALVAVRTEIANINSANEQIFNHTAESKAQRQLSTWFSLYMTHIYKGDKWVPYFEGDTFEAKEEFMWKLEETDDAFYTKAVDKISTYIYLYNMGAQTTEQFKAVEVELQKQMEVSKKAQEEKLTEASKPTI